MPRVYRQQYTTPIPEGAVPGTATRTKKGVEIEIPVVRFKVDGRTVAAPVVQSGKQAGTHCRMHSPYWYGKVNGRAVRLTTNKAASETMLAGMIADAALGRAGLKDAFREHDERPLAAHLDDWAASLSAADVTSKHASQTVACVRRVIEGCGFKQLSDIAAHPVQLYLARLREDAPPITVPPPTPPKPVKEGVPPPPEGYTRTELAAILGIGEQAVTNLVLRHRLPATGAGRRRRYPRATAEALVAMRGRGAGTKTLNLYTAAVKQFCKWLVQDGRLPSSPVEHLKHGNAALNRRRQRRPLSAEEDLRVPLHPRSHNRDIARPISTS